MKPKKEFSNIRIFIERQTREPEGETQRQRDKGKEIKS